MTTGLTILMITTLTMILAMDDNDQIYMSMKILIPITIQMTIGL